MTFLIDGCITTFWKFDVEKKSFFILILFLFFFLEFFFNGRIVINLQLLDPEKRLFENIRFHIHHLDLGFFNYFFVISFSHEVIVDYLFGHIQIGIFVMIIHASNIISYQILRYMMMVIFLS